MGKNKVASIFKKGKMQLENVITKLIKFIKTRTEALSMTVTSGGVDNMEKYSI